MANLPAVSSVQSMGTVGGALPLQPKVTDWPIVDTNYVQAIGPGETSYYTSQNYYQNGAPAALVGTQKSRSEYNLDQEGAFSAPNEHRGIGLQIHLLPDITLPFNPAPRPSLDIARQLLNEGALHVYLGDEQRIFECRLASLGGARYDIRGNAVSLAFTFGLGNRINAVPDAFLRLGEYISNTTDAFFEFRILTSPDFDISNENENGVRARLAMTGYLFGIGG